MIKLNYPKKEEINIIIVTPKIKSFLNFTIKTFAEFDISELELILSDTCIYTELKTTISDYLAYGGCLINISLIHTYYGGSHIILA